jgi:hypothetical protein
LDFIDPLVRLDQLRRQDSPARKAIYERALQVPTQRIFAQCRELLQRMGVPVVFAEVPFEAEGLAAALAKEGLVDYVGTEDSDAIPLGVSWNVGVGGGLLGRGLMRLLIFSIRLMTCLLCTGTDELPATCADHTTHDTRLTRRAHNSAIYPLPKSPYRRYQPRRSSRACHSPTRSSSTFASSSATTPSRA